MGNRKHVVHGSAPKSPKLRHAMKREAEKESRKPRTFPMVPTLKELLRG
jgi:hypothetical protein